MASAAVQTYEELQRAYERALQDYQQREGRYREAVAKDPADPGLNEQYQQLEAARHQLEQLYAQVDEMRGSLANARDEALSRASI